jgi:hypothetical protein
MAGTFFIKQNDTAPNIREQLLLGGSPQTLVGASVRFHLRNAQNGTTKVDQPAIVIDASQGIVEYDWVAIDTNTAGTFQREWEVTLSGGRILTFPNDAVGYDIVITDDIA